MVVGLFSVVYVFDMLILDFDEVVDDVVVLLLYFVFYVDDVIFDVLLVCL